METTECRRCGKVIEGFTIKDLKHRMIMHSIKHNNEMEQESKQEISK